MHFHGLLPHSKSKPSSSQWAGLTISLNLPPPAAQGRCPPQGSHTCCSLCTEFSFSKYLHSHSLTSLRSLLKRPISKRAPTEHCTSLHLGLFPPCQGGRLSSLEVYTIDHTMHFSYWSYVLSFPLEYKLQKGREICLIYSPLCPQSLINVSM